MSVLPTIVQAHRHISAITQVRHRAAHREIPRLAGHERVLAQTSIPDGATVLGSAHAVYVTRGPEISRRIEWADVAAVVPSGLRLWSGDEVRVRADAGFTRFAAERVAATQLLCRRVRILAGTATVTAVRGPGPDDVRWRVQLDSGCDRTDPELGPTVERVVADLRALAGC